MKAPGQPVHSREPQPAVHGAVQVMSPPAVVWYVRQIGAPPGFWAAPWRPHGTRMPRRPLLSRPVRAGWTPFGSVGALRRDARSHIFRRRGFQLDGPAQYGPQGECKTALKPATAPSPSDPCVHRLRLFCDVWQAPAVDFFSCQVLHVMAEMETSCLILGACRLSASKASANCFRFWCLEGLRWPLQKKNCSVRMSV